MQVSDNRVIMSWLEACCDEGLFTVRHYMRRLMMRRSKSNYLKVLMQMMAYLESSPLSLQAFCSRRGVSIVNGELTFPDRV